MRLSEAQVLIAATARRYFEGTSGSIEIPAMRQRWSCFAEFGWLGGILSEEMGGYGGSVELSLLSQQFGAALAPEPWIEAAVIPIVFLSNIVPKPTHRDLCSRIVAGELTLVAASSAPKLNDVNRDAPVVTGGTGRRRLSGRTHHLFGIEMADKLLVFADATEASAAYLVDVSADGVKQSASNSIDGRIVTAITFNDVSISEDSELAEPCSVRSGQLAACDTAIFAQCAQMVGVLECMFSMTQEYLQVRKQFGQPLSSFQVLRHRLADMYAELSQAKAMLSVGLQALESPSDEEHRSGRISACKLRISRAAKFIGSQAIQLHGAIALTEEYQLGAYYKRLLVIEKLLGDSEFHAENFSNLSMRLEKKLRESDAEKCGTKAGTTA